MKNKSLLYSFSLILLSLLVFLLPSVIYAQRSPLPPQIVPRTCTGEGGMCEWNDLLTLVNNFITYLLGISVLVATFVIGMAGFAYYTSGGDESKVKVAKKRIYNVIWGLIIMFLAWLLVKFILIGLGVKPGYSILVSNIT